MEARGSFFFDRPESLCTRVLDPPGSPHAELWAQGTPCGRGRPPPRPLRLPQHRCPALLPQPQGFSDGPENGLSSTRPSSQPGCRVSAPGDRFWRRRTPHSTCEMEVGAMEARGSFFFDRPESLCTRVLDPPGSPHAELWAQGTPCGRGRPPPRPLRLPQHRCPALLPQPQGFSDGPENGLSSTRPSSQPGCRVSASGDRFCGTSNLTAHEQRVTAGPLLSLLFFRPATLIVSVPA